MKKDARTEPLAGCRVIAGVDEAGLGPLLGPLAVGWSVLRLPEPGADPWKLLRGRVQRNPTRNAKLVVADSKRVFTRNEKGARRLETTVLTFLALLEEEGRPPRKAEELLFGALRPSDEHLEGNPWYASLPPLPRHEDPAALELSAAALGRRMAERGLELLDAGVRLAPARELNASWNRTGNKGATTWGYCREVLQHLWEGFAEEGVGVTVDILGGRIHYADLLARAFPGAEVETLFEGPEHSAYRIDERDDTARDRWLPRRMSLEFRQKGEDASFAVALGSCLAKYARELSMESFNAYFERWQPRLAPTAGYTTDGRRWLDDAGPAIRAAGIREDDLVRSR